jgi:hypothetical protein
MASEFGSGSGRFPVFHNFINDPDQTPVDELITDILLPLKERST